MPGSAGEGDVGPEEAAEADGRVLVLRDADAADYAAWADDADGLLVGGHVPDGFEHDVRPVAVGEVTHTRDAFLAALGDDVGGTELPPEIGAGGVSAHEDDSLGAEAPGRQDGHRL